MKKESEIKEEIAFQERQRNKYKILAESQPDTDFGELKRQEYYRVANKHAARRQALLWVIDEL